MTIRLLFAYPFAMGDSGFTVNVSADVLDYLGQRFLKTFGRDRESQEQASWFKTLQSTALTLTDTVQCLGMRDPVPFSKIYQPTRLIVGPDPEDRQQVESFSYGDRISRSILRGRSFDERTISVNEFLQRDQDALIFSGPGWGKTTLMHHIYRSRVRDENVLPVLITLRRPGAVENLKRYVKLCSKVQRTERRACTLLLVDGYDEVSGEEQKAVSEALLEYQAQRAGKFYLTCREYYDVALVKATEVRINDFTREDQVKFVDVFLDAFGCPQDPVAVVKELETRGFEDFLSHPLLLTLACIARTSTMTAQPRSGLRLLRRALEVLCFQWDEQKHISRQNYTPLEGTDRIDILKNIAYRSRSPIVKQDRAEAITRRQLALMRFVRIDPRQVLMEIARFSGILVPSEGGYEFVHRTIHDFLAAQLWVDSGDFAKRTDYEWNARTAYAACKLSNATKVLNRALESPDGLPTVTEILSNAANFHMPTITKALVKYFSEGRHVVEHQRVSAPPNAGKYDPSSNRIVGKFDVDFVRFADNDFLDFIVAYCCNTNSPVCNLLVAYAAVELYHRRGKLNFQTYEKALAAYKTEKFTFAVPGARQAQLGFLNPELQNRMKDYKPASSDAQKPQ